MKPIKENEKRKKNEIKSIIYNSDIIPLLRFLLQRN